ncbi:GNAT family N-acetyltransferase [Bryobacter aggregatus]|uniref:GNAT family N-acetyltransferase n=1 Tax=Bryobacter aggregatus TaxID=360054 RepID=UPI0004E0C3BA|nr:GNAT family N-acetyltransferase [Bryobacter aggregatus]
MPPKFRIPTTAADLQRLLAMMEEFYAHEGIPFDAQQSHHTIRELLDSQPDAGAIYLIESETTCAGYFVLTFGFSLEFAGRFALLDELFLKEEFRGKGWGSLAIADAEIQCIQRGIGTLLLEVDVENPQAAALYERLGFRTHQRRLMNKAVTRK